MPVRRASRAEMAGRLGEFDIALALDLRERRQHLRVPSSAAVSSVFVVVPNTSVIWCAKAIARST